MPVYLNIFDPGLKSTRDVELLRSPGTCNVWLRPLAGASAVHVWLHAASDTTGPSLRAEFDADPSDPALVTIHWDQKDGLHASSPSRRVFTLPANDRHTPSKFLVPQSDGRLDLLFLLDGTSRILAGAASKEGSDWNSHVETLLLFVRLLREQYNDVRLARLFFGDEPLGDLSSAADLDCRYVIYPGNSLHRRLDTLSDEQFREQLKQAEYTSGGDFVDALAEALHYCLPVGWRSDARKLLVVSGDSPGNSVLHGLQDPKGVDARARRFDVDCEALLLHEMHGVEILTIYLGEPTASQVTRGLSNYAQEQYRRLASLRTLAWTVRTFVPEKAVEAVTAAGAEPALARGPSYPILLGVAPSA